MKVAILLLFFLAAGCLAVAITVASFLRDPPNQPKSSCLSLES